MPNPSSLIDFTVASSDRSLYAIFSSAIGLQLRCKSIEVTAVHLHRLLQLALLLLPFSVGLTSTFMLTH